MYLQVVKHGKDMLANIEAPRASGGSSLAGPTAICPPRDATPISDSRASLLLEDMLATLDAGTVQEQASVPDFLAASQAVHDALRWPCKLISVAAHAAAPHSGPPSYRKEPLDHVAGATRAEVFSSLQLQPAQTPPPAEAVSDSITDTYCAKALATRIAGSAGHDAPAAGRGDSSMEGADSSSGGRVSHKLAALRVDLPVLIPAAARTDMLRTAWARSRHGQAGADKQRAEAADDSASLLSQVSYASTATSTESSAGGPSKYRLSGASDAGLSAARSTSASARSLSTRARWSIAAYRDQDDTGSVSSGSGRTPPGQHLRRSARFPPVPSFKLTPRQHPIHRAVSSCSEPEVRRPWH